MTDKELEAIKAIDRIDFDAQMQHMNADRFNVKQTAFAHRHTLLAEVERLQALLKFEADGKETCRNEREAMRRDNQRLRDALREYGQHERDCLAGQGHAGRPTPDGGYEHLFGYGQDAKWYPRGTAPECTCGLDAALAEPSKDRRETLEKAFGIEIVEPSEEESK